MLRGSGAGGACYSHVVKETLLACSAEGDRVGVGGCLSVAVARGRGRGGLFLWAGEAILLLLFVCYLGPSVTFVFPREGGGRGGMEEFPCVGIVGGEVLVEVFRFVVV